jgi:hypothetical protein
VDNNKWVEENSKDNITFFNNFVDVVVVVFLKKIW